EAGIPHEKIPYVTLGTGACECLTALTCGFLIESMGRRALILGGYSLMTLWCAVLTVSLTYQVGLRVQIEGQKKEGALVGPLPEHGLRLRLHPQFRPRTSNSFFSISLNSFFSPGGVTNILTIELFTQSARPAAYTIAGSVSWLSFFTIGMLFPFIVRGLGQYCFLVFLGECALVALFLFLVLPETKNKTFLEIKGDFQRLNFGGGGGGGHVQRTKEREAELGERRHLSHEF
ncbi:hypothetical protein JD844_015264, partial [Phrynosoma platyrhinos]